MDKGCGDLRVRDVTIFLPFDFIFLFCSLPEEIGVTDCSNRQLSDWQYLIGAECDADSDNSGQMLSVTGHWNLCEAVALCLYCWHDAVQVCNWWTYQLPANLEVNPRRYPVNSEQVENCTCYSSVVELKQLPNCHSSDGMFTIIWMQGARISTYRKNCHSIYSMLQKEKGVR